MFRKQFRAHNLLSAASDRYRCTLIVEALLKLTILREVGTIYIYLILTLLSLTDNVIAT